MAKKTYVRTSPVVHAYTSVGTKNYTNSKSVTVKKTSVLLKAGKTYKIKAGVTKLQKGKKLMPTGHASVLRYVSGNKKVATVKVEMYAEGWHRQFDSPEEMIDAFVYYYNHYRPAYSLQYKTPVQYRTDLGFL